MFFPLKRSPWIVNLYMFMRVCVHQVQNEIRLRWIRYQEGSYAVVPVGVKGSQMDTPF